MSFNVLIKKKKKKMCKREREKGILKKVEIKANRKL